MRVAVQGLRMERNRRLLWDMVKIIFNSLMTILIFGLLIGMGNCSYAKHLPHVWTGLVEVRFVWPVNLKSWLFWVIKVNGWNRIDFPDKVFALVSLFMQLILAKLIRFWNITILLGRKNFSESDFMNIPGEIRRKIRLWFKAVVAHVTFIHYPKLLLRPRNIFYGNKIATCLLILTRFWYHKRITSILKQKYSEKWNEKNFENISRFSRRF